MSPWRALIRGLRALLDRRTVEQEMDDEVQHYLAEATAANQARGMAPGAAARAAHRELGNTTSLKEQVRGSAWENVVETFAADVRHSVRRLRATPGFTVVAAGTLALGIGAATAVYSAVKPILFEPLPYPDADRVVMIWEGLPGGARNDGTFGMYRELMMRSRSFQAIAVLRSWQPTLTGNGHPERLEGQRVSAGYFSVLGVAPALGRDFQPSDDRLEGPPVVLLSDAIWRARFAADPAIVGRDVTLNERNYAVIGVMPASFENVLAPAARVWTPLQYDMSQGRAWGHHLRTVGRLTASVTLDDATRELEALAQAVIAELRPPTYAPETQLGATALGDELARAVRPALVAVLAAVALLLVIACVNVANLLLARGVQRRAEFALRAALGAGRGRLARQLLTEAASLALLGGALGMGVAMLGVRAFAELSPPGLPRVATMDVDSGAFAFGFGMAAIIALAIGIIPALQGARGGEHAVLQSGSRRVTRGHRRTRSALVIAEVALALVLLVCSGLLLRSLDRLFSVDTGFDASNLLTVQVQTVGERLSDDEISDRYFIDVLAAVRRVPGVSEAALTSQLPLSGDRDEFGVRRLGETEGNASFRYSVSPGYMAALRLPLRRGRMFGDQDRREGQPAAIVSESLAKRLYPTTPPIGQRIHIGGDTTVYTIVGVVGDVKQASLSAPESDAVYIPTDHWPFPERTMSVAVRSRADASRLASPVREAIWSIDGNQPIVRVALMKDLVAATASERRFALTLFEAFAIAALVLAAAGIYGVLAGSVAERTREIGVRAALGASRADIVALVVRQGLSLAGIGIVIGTAGAAAASRLIASMLFGVTPADPVTWFGVVGLLGGVALIASAVPAIRAARVDPARTLRAD